MTFFERYEKLCLAKGIKPVSEQAAQIIGVTRGTISAWKRFNSTPKASTVTAIAEAYDVSPNYLLGRTDDPTDYAGSDSLTGDTKNVTPLKSEVTGDAEKERYTYSIVALYEQLDATDQAKVEAYMQGLLSHDKYTKRKVAL
jgi:possible bacteriophage transcriptional regulator (fragment)